MVKGKEAIYDTSGIHWTGKKKEKADPNKPKKNKVAIKKNNTRMFISIRK